MDAIGISIHTGWAASVVVGCSLKAPKIVARDRSGLGRRPTADHRRKRTFAQGGAIAIVCLMKFDARTCAALCAGAAAFGAEAVYLAKVPPLQADLGVQISGVLLILWAILLVAVFVARGWRAWWVLAITSPALIGPALLVALVGGCALNTANCP